MRFEVLFLMAAACLCAKAVPRQARRLIVGGTFSQEGAHSNTVYINLEQGEYEFSCGGVLIAPNWVATAAHCVHEIAVNDITIYYGSVDKQKASKVKVSRMVQHAGYDYNGSNDNDIVLFELVTPINNIAPIKVYTGALPSSVTAIGWGTTESGQQSEKLKEVSLNMGTTSQCNEAVSGVKNPSSFLCVGGEQVGVDSCEGDSGGPILFTPPSLGTEVVVGLASYGSSADTGATTAKKAGDCGLLNTWAVYVKLSEFVNWIVQNTGLPLTSFTTDGGTPSLPPTPPPTPSPPLSDTYYEDSFAYDAGSTLDLLGGSSSSETSVTAASAASVASCSGQASCNDCVAAFNLAGQRCTWAITSSGHQHCADSCAVGSTNCYNNPCTPEGSVSGSRRRLFFGGAVSANCACV